MEAIACGNLGTVWNGREREECCHLGRHRGGLGAGNAAGLTLEEGDRGCSLHGKGASSFDATPRKLAGPPEACAKRQPSFFSLDRSTSLSNQPRPEKARENEEPCYHNLVQQPVKDVGCDTFADHVGETFQLKAKQLRDSNEHFDVVMGESLITFATKTRSNSEKKHFTIKDKRNFLLEIMQTRLNAKYEQDDVRLQQQCIPVRENVKDGACQTNKPDEKSREEFENDAENLIEELYSMLEINREAPVFHEELPNTSDQHGNDMSQAEGGVESTRENGASVRPTDRPLLGAAAEMEPISQQDSRADVERHETRLREEKEPGLTASQDQRKIDNALEELLEQDRCKVCADNSIDVIILPCGHYISCSRCIRSLRQCPGCRKFIQATVEAIRI